MADELDMDESAGAAYDDDRLLAYALGPEDDPGLAEALGTDEALGARLEAVRADVDTIRAGVLAAVPAPDESYTDLSDPRWAELKEFFAPAAEKAAKARGGSSRWLRVLAPALIIVLALGVGLVVVQRQNQQSASVAEHSPKAADTLAAASAGGAAGAGGAAQSAPTTVAAQSTLDSIHDQLGHFTTVVLATAHQAQGALQSFVVVRVLKGDGPHVMTLRVVDQPTDSGRLHLLMVEPVGPEALMGSTPDEAFGSESTTATAGPSIAPSPETGVAIASPIPDVIAIAAAMAALGGTYPMVYTYDGELAVVRELPAGTTPEEVVLP